VGELETTIMTASVRRKLLIVPIAAVIGFGSVLGASAAFADESATPSATATAEPTPTPTSTPEPTSTPGPTGTPTPGPTDSPAPVPTEIDLVIPVAGKPALARSVVFGGSAPAGAVITVTDKDKTVLGTTTVGELNTFAIIYDYPDDATSKQTVTVTGTLDGKELNTVKRSFTLPEQNLLAPVITAPVAGSTVYGDQVTFTGTGTPGKNVVVLALPTSVLNAADDTLKAKAAPEPMNPADPIIVGKDGSWTVTVKATPNDYTATAVLADVDDNGQVISLLSDPSTAVQFVLAATPVAPVVIVTPAPTPTPAAAAASGHQLANTGLDTVGIIAAAGLLSLAGLTLVAARRRKNA
jgi:LPXTG-motif cell wall-anchored protein